MAAGAWSVYNLSKKKIGNGTINLASTVFRISLHTSASNANTATLGVFNSVNNEVTEAAGAYSSSGKTLTGETWTVDPTSATKYKFDFDDVVWTATSNAINNIKFAVVWLSAATSAGRHLLCRSQLTTAQFNLSVGNTLTLQINSAGCITLQ